MSRKKKQTELPPGCRQCRNGKLAHVLTDRGAQRCDCPRGIALQQLDRQRVKNAAAQAHLGAPEHRPALPVQGGLL
jgi:hypothetical protein